MKQKDIDRISQPFRDEGVPHLLMVKTNIGITMSCIATGYDIFDFLQVIAEQNPITLEIMQSVIDSKKQKRQKIIVN